MRDIYRSYAEALLDQFPELFEVIAHFAGISGST